MGRINRFDLNRLARDYRATAFFETGTFRGDGVAYALQAPFEKLLSVEIVPSLARDARVRFIGDPRVEIIESDSLSALESFLPGIRGNCIFWLDAHFPGADAGLTGYDKLEDESQRLPLASELETISRLRNQCLDVLIIDDLRIYEDGPYRNGNVPADAMPRYNRNIRFAFDYFGSTHTIFRSYEDEGYLLLFPRNRYRHTHSWYMNLFRKLPLPATDHYLVADAL